METKKIRLNNRRKVDIYFPYTKRQQITKIKENKSLGVKYK